MILSPQQFDTALSERKLRLAFIGMSNIGKSYSSQLFKETLDFEIFDIDTYIQRELKLLSNLDTSQTTGMVEISKWLGYPFDPQYKENQKIYLDKESMLTRSVDITLNKNIILDTTGSVIYLNEEVKNWIRENFLVIHFGVPDQMKEEMIKLYLEHPKPLIWGDSFNQKPGEDSQEALKRCYSILLDDRIKKYETLAHINLDLNLSRKKGIEAKDIIENTKLKLHS